MMRTLVIGAVSALALSGAAFAQQRQLGTADQAKAMLGKTVAAIKADQVGTFAKIDKGEDGFREGDLYPYCFDTTDGKVVASPVTRFMGTDIRALKDPTGNAFGKDLYAAAQKPESQITPIGPYMFPKPGTTAPLFPKVSFVERVNNDVACGVGYYK
jgi:signal transduction histidine kinase